MRTPRPAAAVHRFAGVAAAVFPNEPERGVYNNAVLECDLAASERAEAIAAMEAAYENAGVTRFAAWVHETDRRDALRSRTTRLHARRGDARDGHDARRHPCAATRARARAGGLVRAPAHRRGAAGPPRRSRRRRLPRPRRRHRGENVATGIAFDFGTDCGIYNVGTLEPARRRGLGHRANSHHLHDALARGCQTASLQVDGDRRARFMRRWGSAISVGSSSTSRPRRDAAHQISRRALPLRVSPDGGEATSRRSRAGSPPVPPPSRSRGGGRSPAPGIRGS